MITFFNYTNKGFLFLKETANLLAESLDASVSLLQLRLLVCLFLLQPDGGAVQLAHPLLQLHIHTNKKTKREVTIPCGVSPLFIMCTGALFKANSRRICSHADQMTDTVGYE